MIGSGMGRLAAIGRRYPVTFVLPVVLAVATLAFFSFAQHARDNVADEAEAMLDRARVTLDNWFDRYRALPALYARDPRIIDALAGDPQPGTLDPVSRELAAWNDVANTLDTYILNRAGTAVAASNWQKNQSFVGQNYAFRPYFAEAISGRETGFFGLGTVSGLRGYFLSAPVVRDGRILGVVVLKIPILGLEEALDYAPHSIFVTDTAGVAIISGNPVLRMTATGPVDAQEQQVIDRTRRYDLAEIGPAPLEVAGRWADGYVLSHAPMAADPDMMGTHLSLSRELEIDDWRLQLLYDLGAFRGRLWSVGAAIAASAVAVIALVMLALQRRQRLIDRLADRERDRAKLARRVERRTRELSTANVRLEAEVVERRTAEETLRRTQNELVQAGKLAALGQMSAALSHEFNQPLTAIRTYTENAAAFYEAGRGDRAAENLARVLRLTERVAQLSKHLTRFARRSGDDVTPTALAPIVEEALGLLAARIGRSGARVCVTGTEDVVVLGGAVRLQHVLMNLITNAIDAARPDATPEIEIDVARHGADVEISVCDDGTGIADETLPKIFDPFFTTKEVGRGLGLGLSICFNIVRDFGGTMRAEPRPGGGTRMVVLLRSVPAERLAAE
ncbi:two-component system C4-dicarboxylate transport sensor histidine kinase DctB [Palleronia aestuarii]|uniref:C4-dicarboxylate transport sensor protein DctB n=1 Tax=Palleronia aestuarii TaxID=568105 RepID=A0A2W7NHE4_9RHOB|nr:ATP-binding protein [Palleronia aestuarii]PZX19845.1 two-component system C4-dicarboxylate transport sensor histidine kinase DctB [Palleronia aestuarii]